MRIQTELSRIINAKAAIKAAIEGKGVTVPEATLLDGMASLIESIEAGVGGSGNITTGSFTNSDSYDLVGVDLMTLDEWITNYGEFPARLYAAYFDENPGEITSGYFPLYCASCVVDGNAQICYATVYNSTKVSYAKKTNKIVQVHASSNNVQLVGFSSTYSFKTGRTYRWVIIW